MHSRRMHDPAVRGSPARSIESLDRPLGKLAERGIRFRARRPRARSARRCRRPPSSSATSLALSRRRTRALVRAISSNTGCASPGEADITFSTSMVAACCSIRSPYSLLRRRQCRGALLQRAQRRRRWRWRSPPARRTIAAVRLVVVEAPGLAARPRVMPPITRPSRSSGTPSSEREPERREVPAEASRGLGRSGRGRARCRRSARRGRARCPGRAGRGKACIRRLDQCAGSKPSQRPHVQQRAVIFGHHGGRHRVAQFRARPGDQSEHRLRIVGRGGDRLAAPRCWRPGGRSGRGSVPRARFASVMSTPRRPAA